MTWTITAPKSMQHPVRVGRALAPDRLDALVAQPCGDAVDDGAQLALGRSGADDEVVGQRRSAAPISSSTMSAAFLSSARSTIRRASARASSSPVCVFFAALACDAGRRRGQAAQVLRLLVGHRLHTVHVRRYSVRRQAERGNASDSPAARRARMSDDEWPRIGRVDEQEATLAARESASAATRAACWRSPAAARPRSRPDRSSDPARATRSGARRTRPTRSRSTSGRRNPRPDAQPCQPYSRTDRRRSRA